MPLRFPVMLRQMWSGGAVQKWLDENVNPVELIGEEFAKCRASEAKPRDVDVLLDALNCTLKEHGFAVESLEGAEIDVREERMNQDAQWGGPEHDDKNNTSEWMMFIRYQMTKAITEGEMHVTINHNLPAVRARFVKIAALAQAAVESIDRNQAKIKQ